MYNIFITKTKKIKKRRAANSAVRLAPPSEEMLNIWWDFRKVAEFIDLNRRWLLPLLDTVSSKNE